MSTDAKTVVSIKSFAICDCHRNFI